MDMQRKYGGRPPGEQDAGEWRMRTIGLPLPHDGVGGALRRSFHVHSNDLPADMLSLLTQLDDG